MKLRFTCRVLSFFALLLGIAYVAQAQASKANPSAAPSNTVRRDYRGGLVSPPLLKPTFILNDTSSALFDFRAKSDGYVTLLFFGYTHCPDMCPLQMSVIARALKELAPGVMEQFKVVFVTTDPDRDNGPALRAWLDHFDKHFIGLTGSQTAIDAAQVASHLTPAKKSAVRADGAYEVGHAAFVLAYTRDNLAHVIYPVGVKEEDWVHDLPMLANETWIR